MKDLSSQFGKKLREMRELLGISQDDLALKSGIDRSYVGRIERGEVNISLEKVYMLACSLGCAPCELLPHVHVIDV